MTDSDHHDTRQEPTMSESMMSQDQYERIYTDGKTCSQCGSLHVIRSGVPDDKLLCTGCARPQHLMNPAVYFHTFTAGEAIAAELRDISHKVEYVLAHAIMKLDGPELETLGSANKALTELITALQSD